MCEIAVIKNNLKTDFAIRYNDEENKGIYRSYSTNIVPKGDDYKKLKKFE